MALIQNLDYRIPASGNCSCCGKQPGILEWQAVSGFWFPGCLDDIYVWDEDLMWRQRLQG